MAAPVLVLLASGNQGDQKNGSCWALSYVSDSQCNKGYSASVWTLFEYDVTLSEGGLEQSR